MTQLANQQQAGIQARGKRVLFFTISAVLVMYRDSCTVSPDDMTNGGSFEGEVQRGPSAVALFTM